MHSTIVTLSVAHSVAPQDNFTTAALERRLARSGVIVDEKTKALVQEKKRGIKQGSVATANESSEDED